MGFAYFVIAFVAIAINVAFAMYAGGIAEQKGYSKGNWIAVCIIFGIVGYTLIAALPDLELRATLENIEKKLAKDKTVVMIAHRLSTITNADCIYVLENGHIVESGKHEELLETKGVYEHMWHQYNQSVKWKVQKGDEE